MKTNKNRGFTLLELLIVIAVIGILASIILVSVNSARSRGVQAKVLSEVVQMRTQFEANYTGAGYLDLEGSASNIATLSATAPGLADLTLLICEIAEMNGFPTTVTNDLVLTCDGVPNLRTGVIIYSNQTSTTTDYAVYATTTPGGYICIDSFGNTVSTTSANIPTYANIVSTSTALCQ